MLLFLTRIILYKLYIILIVTRKQLCSIQKVLMNVLIFTFSAVTTEFHQLALIANNIEYERHFIIKAKNYK